jgi:inosine/xanthosine triphosphate pyrophosphatase family protein
MKVLLATSNEAKKLRYGKLLADLGYDIISLKDINLKLSVNEDGNKPLENAIIKAKAYYEATGIPTIAQDDGLIIDNFPEEKQPGTHVRRVYGEKELTDDEMIEYYTSELNKVGGESKAVWKRGLAFVRGKNEIYTLETEDETYFISKPCELRSKGYPLSSIGFDKKYNKYVIELTDAEKEDEWKEYYNSIREFFKKIM